MSLKALIFINGMPPPKIPNLHNYDLIVCTDGAFNYLKVQNFPLNKLDFIIGDFDSLTNFDNLTDKLIYTPDQNHTDFYKALDFLQSKNCTQIDVFGASGFEQDHFLGNLTAAFKFKDRLKITFYDEFGSYFFIAPEFSIKGVKGKIISLIPFWSAKGIITKGLKWSLNNEDLNLLERIGTRNIAANDEIKITYQSGDLLIFINHKK